MGTKYQQLKATIEYRLEGGDWVYFIEILNDILNIIYGMVPTREDIHMKIDAEIPISLIKQMIENEAIQVQDFRNYFTCILMWIRKFGAPSEDKDIDVIVKKVNTMTIESFSSAIPPIIVSIYEQIDIVNDRIKKFKRVKKFELS
jgi:hypothetical protein